MAAPELSVVLKIKLLQLRLLTLLAIGRGGAADVRSIRDSAGSIANNLPGAFALYWDGHPRGVLGLGHEVIGHSKLFRPEFGYCLLK